jgi:hypothetical protein
MHPLASTHTTKANHYVSLSAPSEHARMKRPLDKALQRWEEHYYKPATPEGFLSLLHDSIGVGA